MDFNNTEKEKTTEPQRCGEKNSFQYLYSYVVCMTVPFLNKKGLLCASAALWLVSFYMQCG
jgi:hypothetical protein